MRQPWSDPGFFYNKNPSTCTSTCLPWARPFYIYYLFFFVPKVGFGRFYWGRVAYEPQTTALSLKCFVGFIYLQQVSTSISLSRSKFYVRGHSSVSARWSAPPAWRHFGLKQMVKDDVAEGVETSLKPDRCEIRIFRVAQALLPRPEDGPANLSSLGNLSSWC